MASYKEFVALIDQVLGEIKSRSPEHGSLEWYLSNHISKLSENCHKSNSASEVSNSIKSLMRFAADSLDWDSELSKKVIQISEYHSGLIKGAE
ncbi:hypothetical protein JF535_15555 [Microbulbifer salipaludis]|uniref:Uncharacterized protein n=1 Tax=Microbulbifer salipaludis TaxID=187980 RepID=A0ABS3EAE1_9GAMM|nr:hypothetical protein [Microbulbifer salipaludis]MBN8432264.1 hypothetical protein [Microbulbifer salipaludis]